MDDKSFLSKLQKIYDFVLKSRRSDFYRKKYLPAGRQFFGQNLPKTIKSFDDWQKIPFLTKEELMETSPMERLFIRESEIAALGLTSGTTGSPLAMFQSAISTGKKKFLEQSLKKCGVKRLLYLQRPISNFNLMKVYNFKNIVCFAGDLNDLPLTAQIAAQGKINGIWTTATILDQFLPYLEKVYDPSSIKWVSLGGEFCSHQRLLSLKSKLLRTKFYFRYGGVETRLKGYQCNYLAQKEDSQIFHPAPDSYYEIKDSQNATNLDYQEGELVLTTLELCPTPLIRYLTGDFVTLSKNFCPCGNNYLLELGGRAGSDVLKVSGVMIHTKRIQEAVLTLKPLIEDFTLHVYEEKHEGKIMPYLVIEVILKEGKKGGQDLDFIASLLSKNFYLTPRLTLENLVEKGVFLPLKVKPVRNLKQKGKKRYIIPHPS